MYLAQERRQYILRLLEQRGSIRTTALARELGVTDETIRTDLVAMQARGLLQRIHGGARYQLPSAPGTDDSPRLDVQLARLVAARVSAGKRIYVDAGPFARVLATQLQSTPCTFITPSPRLLSAMAPLAIPHRVICTGGELEKSSGLLTQPEPAAILHALHLDIAILCPPALSPTHASYKHSAHAAWAAAATQIAPYTLLVVPAAALTANATHSVSLPPYEIITEDNIPDSFSHVPATTVPFISEDTLNDFGY